MSTVNDLITGALRLLGAVASGEKPTASESEEALSALNDMLDSWNTESLVCYNINPNTFPMVGGKGTYTLGPGGDWDMARPVQVDSMYLLYTATTGSPLPLNLPVVLLNQDQYNAIIVPNTTTTITQAAYVSDDYPLRNVSLWPVPQINYSLNLFTWQPLTAFDSITDDIALPPGYERMMRFNLALELAPEYGLTPSQAVAAGALASKAVVKRNNAKPLFMSCDPAVTRKPSGFNYLTG